MVRTIDPPGGSTFIRTVRFRRSDNRLNVVFQSGQSMDYLIVPETIFDMFLGTDSFGKIYNNFIKGKFESVPHNYADELWGVEAP